MKVVGLCVVGSAQAPAEQKWKRSSGCMIFPTGPKSLFFNSSHRAAVTLNRVQFLVECLGLCQMRYEMQEQEASPMIPRERPGKSRPWSQTTMLRTAASYRFPA